MRVNGTDFELANPTLLESFLVGQGFELMRIAVERNGQIVPKSDYAQTMLSDADVIEVVRFVGGG